MSTVRVKCNRCGTWDDDRLATVLTAKNLRWTLCSTCRDSLVRWLESTQYAPLVKEDDHDHA